MRHAALAWELISCVRHCGNCTRPPAVQGSCDNCTISKLWFLNKTVWPHAGGDLQRAALLGRVSACSLVVEEPRARKHVHLDMPSHVSGASRMHRTTMNHYITLLRYAESKQTCMAGQPDMYAVNVNARRQWHYFGKMCIGLAPRFHPSLVHTGSYERVGQRWPTFRAFRGFAGCKRTKRTSIC